MDAGALGCQLRKIALRAIAGVDCRTGAT